MSSSIHIEKISAGSFLHNDRTMKVSYLIDSSDKNECSTSSTVAIKKFNELKAEAIKNYTERTHQKIQKSTIFLKEAIVNLQEHHTLEDLKAIKDKLESYGFTVLQMSIHRDEGFVNKDNKKEKNYHAHITMFNLDVESGRTVKFGKNYKSELSKLQTYVAKTLKMTRGKVSVKQEAKRLNVEVSKATRRLNTHDYKRAMKIKEKELELQQAQADYNFREYQKKIIALEKLTTEQKKELHKLNSTARKDVEKILELKEALEEQKKINDTLKEEKNDLATKDSNTRKKINKLQEVYTEVAKALDVKTNNYVQVRDDIISKFKSTKQEVAELTQVLETQKTVITALEKQEQLDDTLKEEKTAYKQDIDNMQNKLRNALETIETQKATIYTLKEENSDLEQEIKLVEQRESELQSFRFDYYSSSYKSYELQKQLRNARETIESKKTTIDTLEQEKSVLKQDMSALKAKYVELRETFEDVAQKLSIKFDTFKQVATDIISKFKSTKEVEIAPETIKESEQTSASTEADEETWELMVKNTEKKQSLKLK